MLLGIAIARPHAASVAWHPCGWCLGVYVRHPFEALLVGIAIARPHVASVAWHPFDWCLVVSATNPFEKLLLGIAISRPRAALLELVASDLLARAGVLLGENPF